MNPAVGPDVDCAHGLPADTVVICPMTVDDLGAVAELDALTMPQPWSVSSYARDLAQNPHAYYYVARERAGMPDRGGEIAGFAGMWVQPDEAHVTVIAVHPHRRRRRLGELLLVELLRQAIGVRAPSMTLEVRLANLAAFRLYARLGFREVGRRRAYYADTGEDGLIMTTPALDDPVWRARFALRCRELGVPVVVDDV